MFKTRTSKCIYKLVNTIVLFSLLILRTSQASNVSAEEVAQGDILYGVDYASEADAAPVFTDVPYSYWAWEWIETLYRNGVTTGCSTNPPMYCPEDAVTRAQMAVFLERGVHGSDYQPPAVGSSTGFNDVATSYWAAAWIKQLAADGITTGCGGGNYCPEEPVTRAQMAVFLLRAEYGAAYNPPAIGSSTGFNDVSTEYWAAAWIKQLAAEGITTGCGNGNYCPEDPVTRAQMAVFLVRTFNLPSSIHPIGELIFHQADDIIAYNWFSYVPRSIDRSQPIYIWVSGIHGNIMTDDYNQMTEESRGQAEWRTQLAEENQYILLVPVIPRPQTNYVYVVSIPHYVFLDETPAFLQRPDLKVNLMIDKLINNLRLDGYDVKDKVIIDGFSAGAMFAQRYALLHPERVQALAAGQCGGAMTLPESMYGTTQMMWPVGVSDFSTLAGYEFDMESYKQVPQYIYIGDQDTHNSTLWGTGEIWRTQAQIDFLNSTFGSTDPVRLQNQVAYLNNLGYSNIRFRLYLGVGHQFAADTLDDIFEFFYNQTTTTPVPSLPFTIDGYKGDWQGYPYRSDLAGDSISNDTDIVGYSFDQDDNFVDIMLETNDPITKNPATLDIELSLQGSISTFELNVNSDRTVWGGNYPQTWNRLRGVLVAWKDVVEIQIPKSVFEGNEFLNVNFISLFTDVNGTWTWVDIVP